MAQPTSSRDFLRAAEQRLEVATFLAARSPYFLDAIYLAGYAMECALKAVVLEGTPAADRPQRLKRITSGAAMHRLDTLFGELTGVGRPIPKPLARRLVRANWSVGLRYETGRRERGDARFVLRAARAACDWAEGQLE